MTDLKKGDLLNDGKYMIEKELGIKQFHFMAKTMLNTMLIML